MKKNIKSILNYLFPYTCIICGCTKNCIDLDLCKTCRQELPLKKSGCEICQANISSDVKSICGNCITTPPPFDKLFAAYNYQSPIDYLVTKLKFQKKINTAHLLGSLLAEHLLEVYKNREIPQIIIPIPLHNKRLRERGFNQALEIARPIAKKLQLKIDKYSCERIKNTRMQSMLNAKEREQNIKNAFKVKTKFNFQYAAIIDDVYTTGNTVCAFCKTLKKSGVKKIDVWCVARG